ncbi:MAG: hypothetical protein RIT27_88 [Pseudomonadota bacterium]|jgi:hypothetical protein
MNFDLLIVAIATYLILLNKETWFMPEESVIKIAIDFLIAIGIITGSISIEEMEDKTCIKITYKQLF